MKRRRTRAQHQLGPAVGCGVDVVEISRFRLAMRRGGRAFMRRVFTPAEESYANARPRTAALHLAGRFAAKEAVIKALSQLGASRLPTMRQVEIRNDRLGRPRAVLHAPPARGVRVHISLSHVNTVAVASAIALK